MENVGNIKIHVRYPDSAILPIPMYPKTSILEVSLRFSFLMEHLGTLKFRRMYCFPFAVF